MRVRAIDADGDWLFGDGFSNYRNNLDAIIQNLSTRLKSILGDCFFSIQSGLDWFNILGQKDRSRIQLIVSSTILNTTGVTAITDFSMMEDRERNLYMRYSINTIYGFQNNIIFSLGNVNIGATT